MYRRLLSVYLTLLIANSTQSEETSEYLKYQNNKDDGKSSLVFVFDTTGSMYNDLRQLKESAEIILKTALEESNIIADFVFVPFHDPGVGPATVTRHKDVFKAALNIVRVYGGGDCPEKSLGGIHLALNVSRPRSFVYVFTDATASDHRLVGKVLDMVQRKQSQVVFVLTGHCNDLHKPSYQVYEQIAAASSGQVFNLNKTSVHKVLEMVRTSIRGRNVNLGSVVRPAGSNHTQGIPVDSTVAEVTVSVSGSKPRITVIDPKGEELTGPPKLVTMLDLSEIMVVKVLEPQPGNWNISVGSAGEYSVRVAGLSNLTFDYGFSVLRPENMRQTSHRPLKGTYNHLLISLTQPDAPVTIDYAEVVNLSGQTLFELPLEKIAKENNTYFTGPFMPPDDFFYVAINGHDIGNQELRRVGATAVQAKLPDVPYLTVQKKIEARSHERVTLTCGVESIVPVAAMWIKGTDRIQPFTSSRLSTSIEYVIDTMGEEYAGMYRCFAKNVAGIATAETQVELKVDPPQVVIIPSDTIILYGAGLNVSCQVFSEVAPIKMQLIFKGDKRMDDDVSDIYLAPREDGIYVYNKTMPMVNETHSGRYTCVAINRAGRSTISTKVTVKTQPLVQILGPHSLKKLIHSDIQLLCHVEDADRVRWIAPNGTELLDIEVNSTYNSMFEVKNVSDSGLWTCVGSRGPYKASDTIDVDILIKPKVRIEGEKNITILNGTSIEVTCFVIAKPSPRIIWHRETESFLNHTITPLEDNVYKSVLMLNSSLEIIAATYFCIGENSQGIAEDNVVVNVRREMKLIKGFNDKSVEIYSQLDLPCQVDSYPTAHITWYHNGTELVTNNNVHISDDNNTVYVLMVDFDNLGLYACVADNGYEKIAVNGTLSVVGLEPPLLSKMPSKITARKGHSTNITCRVLKGKPEPSISWQFRNKSYENFFEIPSGVVLNDIRSELSISVLGSNHAGNYRCVAENILDKDMYDVELVVQYPPQLLGTTNQLSRQEGTLEIKAGERVQFSCEAVGMPPPMVVWTKDHRPLSFTNNVYLTEGNHLVIEKASEYDSGIFTCSAISILGSSEKNFTLFVYVPPTILPVPFGPDVEVLEGQLVELPCAASAVPAPSLHWLHDGEAIYDARKYIDEFGIRFVANLTDFGNYTCAVENGYGNASVSYFLYIWVVPSVHPLETSKSVLIGNNVSLQCDAVGFPLPLITWEFKNEAIVENTTDVSFNAYGNLYIINARAEQDGNYACVAVNVAGIDKKTIHLNVNEPPKIVNNEFPGPYIATNMDKELVLPCNVTGKPKPYTAWIKDDVYLDNDAIYYIDFDGSLMIKSPTEELSGFYTCVAMSVTGDANVTIPVEIYSVPSQLQSEESQIKVSVVEGTNATVECPIRASPKDVVKWYKDARLISYGVLHINNISRHNSSDYACVVTNVAGSAYSKIRLEVEWPPSFESGGDATPVEVIRGNDWYFDCGADAKPKAKTKWLFNSKPMIFEDKERLKLLNVEVRHTGTYECVVTNNHGTAKKLFTLEVLVPPFITEFDFLEVQLMEGSEAVLDCNAKGSPKPDIKWTFNNTNWQLRNSSLVSQNVTVDSEGIFRCDATNKAGTSYVQYQVFVVYGARVQEIVLYSGGEASTVLKRAEIVKNTRIRISCKSLGQPTPKIQWIRNGNSLSENLDGVSYADLVINDVHAANAGVYSCVVSNIAGTDEEKIRLDVLEPPKIFQNLFENKPTGNTVELQVLAGQAFSLHCHPYGNPMPEVYWFKDDLPLKLFDDKMVSTDYGEVIVSNKALYDQSGNYTCVARNKIGNTSLIYLVDVLVPPPTPKESIRISTARAGKLLNLTCPVEGSPTPHVFWLRQPYLEITEHTPRVTLLNDNFTLILNKTEVGDSGKYSCVMTNKVGTTEVVFDVTIEMPPYITGNVGPNIVENHVVPLMRSIVLLCDVKSHPAPIITWLKDTQEIREDSSNVQRVLDSSLLGLWHVTSQAAGQYICVAENKAGAAHRRYNLIVQVPGKWTTWSPWGFCNVTCGLGYQQRARSCQYVDEDNVIYDKTTTPERIVLDEAECKGSNIDKRKCHMPPCENPISAKWSPWSKWTSCSATCGAGSQTRTRRCKSLQPCYGDNVQIRKCPNMPKCDASTDKRENEIFGSVEHTTETDLYMPEETYEMQPDLLDGHKYKPSDLEVLYTKSAPSSMYYDVNVTTNLDFSDPDPCDPGFRYNTTANTCDDIDECAIENNQCHATQLCANSMGAYRCGCQPGFAALGAGQRCLDLNECEQETDGCEFACVNVAGGYVCACPKHLRLHLDNHHCVEPSAYQDPYILRELDTGDYLSASIELPPKYAKNRLI